MTKLAKVNVAFESQLHSARVTNSAQIVHTRWDVPLFINFYHMLSYRCEPRIEIWLFRHRMTVSVLEWRVPAHVISAYIC